MLSESGDWIYLTKLSFPCVLGLPDREQRRPQTLEVEVGLNLDLDRAAGGDLAASVNYRKTLDQLQFIAEHGRWRLLESLAAAMARHLLAPPASGERRAQVDNVVICLGKPEILQGRALPRVQIRRSRHWCTPRPGMGTDRGGATLSILQETGETGAYHLQLPAGATWEGPTGVVLYVLTGRLELAGAISAAGETVHPQGRSLKNSGQTVARLLVISQPPLAG